jgi:tRNA dimethylallyltransferase
MKTRLTFILGCTGCGKGALGRELARRLSAEIVSIDSMKVYRRMDVGTAKPDAAVRAEIPHHLIDVVEPWEEFSVAQFVERAERAIAEIQKRGRPILCVGGTALYIKALTEGLFEGPSANREVRERLRQRGAEAGSAALHAELTEVDAVAAERIHPNDLRRIVRALEVYELTGRPISAWQTQWDRQRSRYDVRLIGLRRTREDQNHHTNARIKRMIEQGLVDEVRSLLAEPRPLSATARRALGYAEIITHLEGKVSLEHAVEMIKINTRKFAKAQRTWFKRFRTTEWIDVQPGDSAELIASRWLETEGSSWWSPPR